MNIGDMIMSGLSRLDEIGLKDETGHDIAQVKRAKKNRSEGKNTSIGDTIHSKRWGDVNDKEYRESRERKQQESVDNKEQTNRKKSQDNNNYSESNRADKSEELEVPTLDDIMNTTPKWIKKWNPKVLDEMKGHEIAMAAYRLAQDESVRDKAFDVVETDDPEKMKKFVSDYITGKIR